MKIKTNAQTDFKLFSSTIVTTFFVYVDKIWHNKWYRHLARTGRTPVFLYACMNSQKSYEFTKVMFSIVDYCTVGMIPLNASNDW